MKALTNANIAEDIRAITSALELKKYAKRDILRLTLTAEETLLQYQDQFGEETLYEIGIRRTLLIERISISVRAPKFDCREQNQDSEAAILRRMAADDEKTIIWQYKRDCNTVMLFLPMRKAIPGIVWILLAVLLSVGAYALCGMLPARVSTAISDAVIPELYNIMYAILRMIAGLLIFFTILSGIVQLGNLGALKSTIQRIAARTVLNDLGIIAVCVIALSFFAAKGEADSGFDFAGILYLLADMIPRDIFNPFINGNMMQITFLSVAVGILLLVVGRADAVMQSLIETGKRVMVFSMQFFCKYLPVLVFLNIFTALPSFKGVSAKDILIPTAVGLGVILLMMLLQTAGLCFRWKHNAAEYVKAVMPATLIGLTTASTSASLDGIKKDLRLLGVEDGFIDLVLPLEQTLYKPFSIIIIFAGVLAVSLTMEFPLSPGVIVNAAVLAVVIAIACPSVPGGMLSCLTILCTQLQLPEGAMGILILFATIFDYFGGALSVFSLHTDVVGLAHRLGKVAPKEKRHGKKKVYVQ